MTDHFRNIYDNHADDYERMVEREDYQGNLLKSLREIHPLESATIVEFGAGTARLTEILVPHVHQIMACDIARGMLSIANREMTTGDSANWALIQADNRQMPFAREQADITIEGWSFGHLRFWFADNWRDHFDRALGEMTRLLKPGGVAILLETMGTGQEEPAPPAPELGEVYAYLENDLGFESTAIRTDYRFKSVDEADELTRFFFGDELADRIRTESLTVLPECTGIWWKRK